MKKKKNLKGMTLVEIIISLAVFAMLGAILLRIGCTIDSTTKAASRLNKRVNEQSPYAASQTTKYAVYDSAGNYQSHQEFSDKAINIDVSVNDKTTGAPKKVSVGSQIYDAEQTISAKCYNTHDIIAGNSSIYDPTGPNAEHDLKFIVIENEIPAGTVNFDNSGTPSKRVQDVITDIMFPEMEWISTDESVAVIDNNGNITPNSSGNCKVMGTTTTGLTYVIDVVVG